MSHHPPAGPPQDARPPGDRLGAVTAVLREAADGALTQDELVARLMPVVYDELREIARAQRRRYATDAFRTTALVHEAYLRLDGREMVPDRAYVFAAAARAMRNVLVDHARRRTAQKRGGDERPLGLEAVGPLDSGAPDLDTVAARVLDVDAALDKLAGLDARAARVVECRYFGGLSFGETAEALEISEATAKRDWRRARAWLHQVLAEPPEPGADGAAGDPGALRTSQGRESPPPPDDD